MTGKDYIISCLLTAVLLFSCQTQDKEYLEKRQEEDAMKYNPDWTETTHGNVDPSYNAVFPQETVNRIEISMTQAQWNAIRTNMTALTGGDFGAKKTGGVELTAEPDYQHVLLRFNNKQWKNVGFRLKGNSSLRSIWSQGNYKLPFRLNFDKFEDQFPQIKNQHFYGFEELSFSPGFKDPSLLHEKLAADVFRMGGIAAPHTAFCRVYIDFGSGLKYCGVYTCVEVPEDNMIKAQFGEEKGNIYKPTSRLAIFNPADFEKKNNDSLAVFIDLQQFITILNKDLRKTNSPLWRKELESTFNVSHFLLWLAINNTLVNWDSYGAMAHNYYLYNHSVRKLTWIPWDNNEAFTGNPGITKVVIPGQPPGPQSGLSLTMNEVNQSWPLIRYLADDTLYFQTYRKYLGEFIASVFNEAVLGPAGEKAHQMILPYVIGAEGEQPGYSHIPNQTVFVNSLQAFKSHISARNLLVSQYLNQ
jgi:hypothetical protein